MSPAKSLTLRLLIEAAERGEACPTNDQIGQMLGNSSSANASYTVAKLEREGHIRVERFQSRRRITIVSTGKSTAPLPSWCQGPHNPRGSANDR